MEMFSLQNIIMFTVYGYVLSVEYYHVYSVWICSICRIVSCLQCMDMFYLQTSVMFTVYGYANSSHCRRYKKGTHITHMTHMTHMFYTMDFSQSLLSCYDRVAKLGFTTKLASLRQANHTKSEYELFLITLLYCLALFSFYFISSSELKFVTSPWLLSRFTNIALHGF